MSFLYPRTITILRPAAQAQGGVQTIYQADRRAEQTTVASDLPANIQARREGQKSPVGLPGDGTMSVWYAFIPKSALSPSWLIEERDEITDDLGRRFQVISDYVNSLGYRLTCHRLEA